MNERVPSPGFNVEALLREQRRRHEAGTPALVEELLRQHPELADSADALLDLINHEIVLRAEFATPPSRAEYLERFPKLRAELVMLFEVQEAIDASDDEQHGIVRPVAPAPRVEPSVANASGSGKPQEVGNLADLLDGTPQSAIAAARLVAALAQSVQAAHAQGIIHRDLKPAQILLARISEAAPKIAGFGLAARTQVLAGTPSYMAPEQGGDLAKPAGPTVDIYALGAILYELITGRPPFRGENALDTLEQVRMLEVVDPRCLQPRCPRDLETICLKCLCKKPAQRYASAGDLADDLGRFLRNAPIRARPTSNWQHFRLWCRRHPGLAAMLGAIGLLTLLSEGLLVYLVLRAR